MSKGWRERVRIQAADLAQRALRPATHAEVLALFVLLLDLGTIGFGQIHHEHIRESHQHVTNARFRTGQLRACHRLNVMRAESNLSQLRDFEVFDATVGLLHASLTLPQTYAAKIQDDILAKEWTPLTDCYAATDHPVTYQAPNPIHFGRTIKGRIVTTLPPPSALYVGPGM